MCSYQIRDDNCVSRYCGFIPQSQSFGVYAIYLAIPHRVRYDIMLSMATPQLVRSDECLSRHAVLDTASQYLGVNAFYQAIPHRVRYDIMLFITTQHHVRGDVLSSAE